MEKVDILKPPDFQKTGVIKSMEQAFRQQNWTGSFHLWIIQDDPEPSIVYQIRSLNKSLMPNKFDVSAAGHYQAGETVKDGLREVKEELGKTYRFSKLISLGRKLFFGKDLKNHMRYSVVDVFLVLDNSSLETYTLQKNEVYAVCTLPIHELIKIFTKPKYSFTTKALTNSDKKINKKVTADSFIYNWDNYQYKITLLAERFLKGEKNLVY